MNKNPIIPINATKADKMRTAIIKKVQKLIKHHLNESDSDESEESISENEKDPYEIGALDSLLTEIDGENNHGSKGGFRLNLLRLRLLDEKGQFNPDNPRHNNLILNCDDRERLLEALTGDIRKEEKKDDN